MSETNAKLNAISNIVRDEYSPRTRVAITFPANSRWTKQSFKDECDVNTIMRRYQSTGEMPVLNQRAPQYLDATGFDYQQAMEFVAGAKTLFGELPSDLRNRFGNDPAAFLDFCSQEKNRPEMAEMGLLKPVLLEPVVPGSTPPVQAPIEPENTSV